MAKLNITSKKYLVIALAVLVVVLSAVLLYVQANVLRDLRVQVEEEEISVISAQTRLNNLVQHRNNAQEYEMRLNEATRKVPDQAGEDQVLRYIHRLAGDNNLNAVEIRFGGRSEAEGYTNMLLSITLEGGFQDTRIFLRQLRHGGRAIRVDDIRLNRMGDADASLRVNISAYAFYNHNN